MQVAPYMSEQTTVLVSGRQPESALPPPIDYNANQAVHESRYRDTAQIKIRGEQNGDMPYSQQYVIEPQSQLLRARSVFFMHNWQIKGKCQGFAGDEDSATFVNWETAREDEKDPYLDLSITPMLGLGCTAWESIDITIGLNDTRIRQTTRDNDHVHWMTFMADTKKNPLTMKWIYHPALFYDVHSFNYCGGIKNFVAVHNPGDGVGDPAVKQYFTYNAKEPNTLPTNPSPAAFPGYPQGQYDIQHGNWGPFKPELQGLAGGLWFDEELRKAKTCFIPHRNVLDFWTATNGALLSSFFDNILELPPMRYIVTFNAGSDLKPRFYETPVVLHNKNADAALSTTSVRGLVGENFNIFPNRANSYVMLTNVELRPDIQQAWLDSWTLSNAALQVPVKMYQHYSFITQPNVSGTVEKTLMASGSNLPYKTIIATRPELPITGLDPAWASPKAKNFPSFAYGDSFWRDEMWNVTQPVNRKWNRINTLPCPRAFDPLAQREIRTRGMIMHEHYIQEINYRTGAFKDPDFTSIDSYTFEDLWTRMYMPPMGFAVHTGNIKKNNDVDLPIEMFGSQSVTFPNNSYFNSGPSNIINTWLYAATGYDDPGFDNGIYKGAMMHEFHFHNPIPTAQRVHMIWAYNGTVDLIGNNSASKDIPLA